MKVDMNNTKVSSGYFLQKLKGDNVGVDFFMVDDLMMCGHQISIRENF